MEAEMTLMAADINKAPKGEYPSGLRVCDLKEEKELALVAVEWGVGGRTIF